MTDVTAPVNRLGRYAAISGALGALLVIVGVVLLMSGDGGEVSASPPAPASATDTPTATDTPAPTPAETSTPAPTETATPATPTATAAPTPSPVPTPLPAESVADFVLAFDTALSTGDLDFVFERIHPVAIAGFGAEFCRQFVDSQFSQATAMSLQGEPAGPSSTVVETPAGETTIDDYYTGAVELILQGQTFEIEAGWAVVDGKVFWLTSCN